jgi:hypothetical protein
MQLEEKELGEANQKEMLHYLQNRLNEMDSQHHDLVEEKRGCVFCFTTIVCSSLFLVVCACRSLSYPYIAACLHSLTPHDTSLTTIIFIPPSINQPTNQSTQYSHYL